MRIIHLSITPLAGAPIRLVKALNKYTNLDCNLIVFDPGAYGNRTFPNDLIWDDNKDECINLIQKADILHCHHAVHEIQKLIPELDLKTDCKAKMLRQHHSAPYDLRVKRNNSAEIVIPHCPERYFPNARIVPNIVDNAIIEEYISSNADPQFDFSFAPSILDKGAFDKRWSTKAAPEVIRTLKAFPNVKAQVAHNIAFNDTIKIKSQSKIIIDDVATGSIHLGSLEAANLGKPVICHLDLRMRYVLKKLTGAKTLPFILCSLEKLKKTIAKYKNASDDNINMIGIETKKWMEKFYSPKKLVQFYIDCYEDILKSEDFFLRESKKHRRQYNNTYGLFLIYYSEINWNIRRLLYTLKNYQRKKL